MTAGELVAVTDGVYGSLRLENHPVGIGHGVAALFTVWGV